MHRPTFVALATVVALSLAGCGGSTSSSPSAAATTASSSATSTSTKSSASTTAASATPFLSQLTKVSTLHSTVPATGDVNPYGIVMVPTSVGKLHAGALLVSNYNDKANNQGTGTTIDQIRPSGRMSSLFAHISARSLPGSCPGGVGLTTALSVLPGAMSSSEVCPPPTANPRPRATAA